MSVLQGPDTRLGAVTRAMTPAVSSTTSTAPAVMKSTFLLVMAASLRSSKSALPMVWNSSRVVASRVPMRIR